MDVLSGTPADAPSLASRLAARVTSHGSAQSAMIDNNIVSFNSTDAIAIDESTACLLTASRAASLNDTESELRQAADSLVDIAYATPFEMTLWCAIQRHFQASDGFSLGDVRQYLGSMTARHGRLRFSFDDAVNFLRELIKKVFLFFLFFFFFFLF